ncbi:MULTISPECIES: glycosyl transferase [unclassified Microbacterium]|uniref:glycosyl transferase n=1 Tax=Microbacterium TaxID=33882 RepID=UPI003B9E0C69
MPAAVHAVLVARSSPEAVKVLGRTLEAVRSQTRPVDALTIVVCGPIAPVRELVSASGAEGVIEASAATPFAAAVEFALRRVTPGASVWLLAHDATPDATALAALAGELERGPSIAIAAPKLVDADDADRIVSLGQSMTGFGRAVELADGEFDQGQYDALDDVLGSDIRGVLVRGEVVADLVPDRALLGVDEGLDLGVRAHLAGRRVALVPRARVAVPRPARKRMRDDFRQRTAQLHRRLAYAPAWAVLLHWLSFLPLALWKTAVQLIAKNPAFVPAEWAAAIVAMARIPAVARSRARIRRTRRASWAAVDALRATRESLRERQASHDHPVVRRELRFFSGGGAWAVLAAGVVSVVAFLALLSWPGVAGGALLPLARTVSGLWAEAAFGRRAVGLDVVSPADPFAAVTALLGSLWPGSPSFALLALWLLALPLAVLGAWFAATRVTVRSGLRVVMAALWALAPSFLSALVDPRPAAVLVHLLLPWLLFAGAAAHRSWGAAGTASLLLAAVVACAPSLAPALVVVWALGLVLTCALRPRGIARVVWTLVPSAALAFPLVLAQLDRGTPWALLADPGRPWAGPVLAADERWRIALGFPTSDPGGWGGFLAGLGLPAETWWVPILLAPVALAALVAPLTRRWRAGIAMIVIAVLGLATAGAALSVQVAWAQSQPVAVWPGAGLSLAWLGLVAAAVIAFDVGFAPRAVLRAAALIATACVLLAAIPSLTAVHRGQAALRSGTDTTLPAYVSAQAAIADGVATLVLAPQPDGGVAASVVWGASETLGGQSTLQSTQPALSDGDRRIAEIATDLVAGSSADATGALAERGVGFVLLAAEGEDSDAARVLRLSAATAIDQRAGLVRVGETPRGVLWSVDVDRAPRPAISDDDAQTARGIALIQLIAVAVALLLAVPTPASHRAARRKPRVIAAEYEEVS